METRTFCFVAVFLATFATTTPESLDTSTEEALVASEAQNVLDECQNSDYRTYIKCLKRQKRHHFPHSDFDPTCLDSCPKRCHTEHECEMKCGHCMRKTKHRHQIITEYETECSSGECRNTTSSDKELGSTNITTKIDIHNVINNNVTTQCTTPDCSVIKPPPQPPVPPTVYPPPVPPTIHPPIPSDCVYPPPFPCYPYPPIYPQYQPSVSQISTQLLLALPVTTGIGANVNQGLCGYSNQWPCLPNWGWGYRHGASIDCSGCWHPSYHYKCDTQCYNNRPSSSCTSPNCGGYTIVN